MKFKIKNASKKLIASICKDYTKGSLSLRKIASKYSCSNPSIMKILKNEGIVLRNKTDAAMAFQDKVLNLSQAEMKEMCKMYENGNDLNSIAENFNISKLSVSTVLMRMGVSLRCNRRIAMAGVISDFKSTECPIDYSITKRLYDSISAMERYTKCKSCGIIRDKSLKVCTVCFYKNLKRGSLSKNKINNI